MMPALGLGVFQTPPDVTTGAVEEALRHGYRHIDTAAAYANEREVGEGIRRSGVARDEVFLETKVWISDYGDDATLHAFDKSSGKLRVDRLDLPPSAAVEPLRSHARRLPGARATARRRQGARHRREQLHARASRRPADRDVRGARREPDRAPSVLPAARAATCARRARHRDPGVVADRRRHLLRGRREAHVRRPDAA
jgi:aryl-alcohol dehydrogenase-like predicted oxidoreductase